MVSRRWHWNWMYLLAVVCMDGLVSPAALATTVAISRMNDGVVCNGWAVNPNIIATAAHCVLTPGHYWVSTADKTYQVLRIWIHPEFSPELLYLTIFKNEFHHDLALLQVVQRDFSVETHDHVQDKSLLQGSTLFAVRAKAPEL